MADDQEGAVNEDDRTVPPRGWESAGPEPGPTVDDELDAFAALIAQLLATIPAELRLRLTDAARSLLQALRALLDWLADMLGAGQEAGPVEVHDIPIL